MGPRFLRSFRNAEVSASHSPCRVSNRKLPTQGLTFLSLSISAEPSRSFPEALSVGFGSLRLGGGEGRGSQGGHFRA